MIIPRLKTEFPDKRIELTEYEFDRPGTTTCDALQHMIEEEPGLNPHNFIFIVGQDYIYPKQPGINAKDVPGTELKDRFGSNDLSTWGGIGDIFRDLASFCVIPRNYKDRRAFKDTSEMDLSRIEDITGLRDILQRIMLISMAPVDISSTSIRNNEGNSYEDYLTDWGNSRKEQRENPGCDYSASNERHALQWVCHLCQRAKELDELS